MPHQINRCRCGRTRHWPANARVGDTWRCRRCGRVTTLVAPGTPGADDRGVIVPSGQNSYLGTRGKPFAARRNVPSARSLVHQDKRGGQKHGPGLLGGLLLGLAVLATISILSKTQ